MSAIDPHSVAMLRHAVATLAYRSGKALRDAPPSFPELEICPGARTPVEVLTHMGDLLEWALSIADGKPNWAPAKPLPWDKECKRYFAALAAFDARLASSEPIQRTPERLLQAPVADALTHTGQLTLMRRLAGSPVRGENYYVAPIAAGKVGPDQDPPRAEL